MTHIAFFAPLLTTGGTQRHLQQVLSLLDPARWRASVFTLRPGGEVEAELAEAGVTVRSLHVGRRLTSPRACVAMLRAARLLRTMRVDIVHGYQWRPALVGSIVGRLAGVPLLMAGKRSLTGDDRTARRAWRVIGRRVDTIVANADALRVEAERQGVRAQWTIIPSGVDVTRFQARATPQAKAALGLDATWPVVGAVGRFEPRKGHELLLHALRDLAGFEHGARVQLLLVGDGPLRPVLERQARDLGVIDRVRFTGTLEDVRPALAAMDVFVLPSQAEGMSNALLEALAAARPVVATDVGGTREVCDGRETGLLVPADDAAGIARAVASLLADGDRAARLGRAGRALVEARFGAQAMVDRLAACYTARLAAATRREAA